ncbi:X-box-binding protein 1 [Ischnura elegans]|uniref:X-box-binding protein 1 n=1 Tax=Ischnura elegans TaxID=197161 RepID=UPI001ED89D9C|nr:X-box-binding protein 1 [Ischnura elegans]
MESPPLVIIHVPQFSSNIPVNSSASSPRLVDESERLNSCKSVVARINKLYPRSKYNSDREIDGIMAKCGLVRDNIHGVEDKTLRKKLKNRMAAQTSRDRKKARMEELERAVKELQQNNTLLNQTCDRLKTEVASLKEENVVLKQKLRLQENVQPIEPAVFINDPLQKGQGFVLLMYLCLLSYFLTAPKNTYRKLRNLPPKSLEVKVQALAEKWIPSQCTAQVKWGRHQRSWNPEIG